MNLACKLALLIKEKHKPIVNYYHSLWNQPNKSLVFYKFHQIIKN
jgi:hypothetical protein